ncbi:isoamyl alcohol oxidase [Fusarium tjaetaba]|uniref:Isoamyl alcohol oxidase n=1 Tax=Fusarium tjaetaba TaxID=1567544 RepID=A0A8H5QSN1_9HYPO|nr:isoamyl alcohol oxidase [Fusarium tjaetaba]KAF5620589.1 isoamyl alcohol oxidase [Fusarium tjaetaba]
MPHPIIFNGSLGLGLMLVGLGLNATLRPNHHLQSLEFPIPTEPLAKKFSLALMRIWGIRNITVGVLISIIWTTGDETLMAKALSAAIAMPITDGFGNIPSSLHTYCQRNFNMRSSKFCLPALAVVGAFVTSGYAEDQCRCIIGESCWPSTETWASLNSTVDGHLIRYIPPGAVCYKAHSSYNPVACEAVIKQWSESKFHSSDPASLHTEWANAGCTPVYENGTSIYGDAQAGERGCSNGAIPTYVVNATTVYHVVAAMEFASEHNIRLVIKNTGHASNGRNLGNSSLSIWTHNMKRIELLENFILACPNAQNAPSPRMAATVGAGVQDGEMYEALAGQNALAVGGTRKYGQGADNILEAELVTPAGKVLIANECQNQDLYWAIRGGGGGTFGVITKLTVKAYPAPTVVMGGYDIKAKNQTSEEEFYNVIADAHALFPAIQDAGVHGYYTVTGLPQAEALTFSGSFMGFDISNKTYDDALEPFRRMLGEFNSTINWSFTKIPVSTWQGLLKVLPEIGTVSAGYDIRASRLISRQTVIEKRENFAAVYKKIGPTKDAPSNGLPNLSISGTLTISPKPVNNSLHPSWRSATVHLITGQSWTDSTNETEVRNIIHDMTYRKLALLRELDPAQGAYLNEANSIEPGWQWSFWGPNYARLRDIKEIYDPNGILWCPQCVGSEDCVQRQDGRLCRAFTPW